MNSFVHKISLSLFHAMRIILPISGTCFSKTNINTPLPLLCIHYVEHNGSGAELRTLNYENPGSNPVLRC